jgi:hypothetical protein
MNSEDIITTTLKWLYARYKESPDRLWDIGIILREKGITGASYIQSIGSFLKKRAFVKHNAAPSADGFLAGISMHGISRVSGDLRQYMYLILRGMIENQENSFNEILRLPASKKTFELDLVHYMSALGLLAAYFSEEKIQLELCLEGRRWYEDYKMQRTVQAGGC